MSNLWAPRIYSPEGYTKENIFTKGEKVIDIGCGSRKLPGARGMDRVKDSEADIIHDIEKVPWPLPDSSYDLVFMNHSLEHVDDVLAVLGEVHRIAKKGARVVIQVPHFRASDAYVDPTHRHFFTSHSLDYFLEGTLLSDYHYVPFRFKKLGFWYGWPHPSKNPIRQFVKNLSHKYPDFYDQYLSLILPVECVTWELEVVK